MNCTLSYSRDIAFLKSEKLINSFVERYNERSEDDKQIEAAVITALIDIHLKPTPDFAYPRLAQINKMGSKSSRRIFIFPEAEKLLLKYINYAIGELNLEIDPHCYSFQRGQGIVNAIRGLQRKDLSSLACIKVDISDYFNSIPTSNIDSWLPKSLKSHPYLAETIKYLILRKEVYVEGLLKPYSGRGVMAGMPLAPTLSNLYLKHFDREMASTYPAYARYSDDMVLFCKEDMAYNAYEHITDALAERGLKINETKTKIYKPGEGFEFLGLYIRDSHIDLSKATIMKIKGKIKRQARSLYRWQKKKNVPLEKTVMVMNRKFNRKFYGLGAKDTDFTWSRYFFHLLTVDRGLREVDRYYQETVRYLASGRYSKSNYRLITYEMLKETGYIPLVSAYYRRLDSLNPGTGATRLNGPLDLRNQDKSKTLQVGVKI